MTVSKHCRVTGVGALTAGSMTVARWPVGEMADFWSGVRL
jgi:hypothetical protein